MSHIKGTKVRSPRAAVRNDLTRRLRAAAHLLRLEIAVWAGGSTEWTDEGLRYRTLGEYPENRARALYELAHTADVIAGSFASIARDARREAAKLDQ